MSDSPKISIIVPVYKTAAYLPRCLDSLLAQTLPELEIIAVNDASPDNAAAILAEYAARDARLKVINLPQNGGVAAARNLAMQQAGGEYIGFVDSDDWVAADFYAKLYAAAKAEGAELAVGNVKEIAEDGQETDNPYIKKVMANIARHKLYFSQLFVLGLYQAEMLRAHKIEFTAGLAYGEDRLLPLQAAFYCRKFVFEPEAMYFYFHHRESATSQILSAQSSRDIIQCINCIVDFLNAEVVAAEDYEIVALDFWVQLQYLFMNIVDDLYIELHPQLCELCAKLKYPRILQHPSLILLQYFLTQPQGYVERRHIAANLLKILRSRHLQQPKTGELK